MRVENVADTLRGGETVLIRYDPTCAPERAFYNLVMYYNEKDIPILVVDVVDTLHIFKEHLSMMGVELPFENLYVIKDGGRMKLGRVLGKAELTDDFHYHASQYGRIVRPFFEEFRDKIKVVIVIGTEKFVLPFQDKETKVEEYFEKVARPPIFSRDKITFIFINEKVASPRIIHTFEEISQYVLRLSDGLTVLKSPLLEVGE